MKTNLLSLILLLTLLAGCISAPTPGPTSTATATLPPTATATAEPSPTPTATPVPLPMEIPPADAVYPSSIEDRLILPEQIQAMRDAFLKIADDPAIKPKVDLIKKNLLAIAQKDGIQSPTVRGYVDGDRWGMVVRDAKGTIYRLQSTPAPIWKTLEGREAYQLLYNYSSNITPYRFNPLEQPVEIPEGNHVVVEQDSDGYSIVSLFDPTSQEVFIMEDGGYFFGEQYNGNSAPWFSYNIEKISKVGLSDAHIYAQGYIVQDGQWIIIFQGSSGQQYVLQRRNEPEWSNSKDAGAYIELSSDIIGPDNFRLVPIAFPGIPEDAKFVLVNQEGWMVSAFIEPSGKIAAWYNAQDAEYETKEGISLNTYRPLSEMTSWEECVAPEQQLPWIDDPEFGDAWQAFLDVTTPAEPPKQYDYFGLNVATIMMLSNEKWWDSAIYKYNWSTSSLAIARAQIPQGQALACATMKTENGEPIQIIRFAVRVVPDTKVQEYGTAYVYITAAVDENLLLADFQKIPGTIYEPEKQKFETQFSILKDFDSMWFILFTKDDPITTVELTDPLTSTTARLISENKRNGIQDALLRLLTYQIEKSDIELINHAILPMYYCNAWP